MTRPATSWWSGTDVYGGSGKAKAIVKGKGTRLAMPLLPPTLPVRAQLSSTAGACWEAEFQADGVVQSTPTTWSGKAHLD